MRRAYRFDIGPSFVKNTPYRSDVGVLLANSFPSQFFQYTDDLHEVWFQGV